MSSSALLLIHFAHPLLGTKEPLWPRSQAPQAPGTRAPGEDVLPKSTLGMLLKATWRRDVCTKCTRRKSTATPELNCTQRGKRTGLTPHPGQDGDAILLGRPNWAPFSSQLGKSERNSPCWTALWENICSYFGFFHLWFMTSKAPTCCFSSHLLILNFADIKTRANSCYFCTYFLILFYPMCIVLWNKEHRIFIRNKPPLLVPCSGLGFSPNPCFCHEITPAVPPHKNATCTKIATSKSLLIPICRSSAPNPAPSLA